MQRGSILISFDLEKAWGIHDSIGVDEYHDCLACGDENIKFILTELQKYRLKSDWAFVGQMIEDDRALWRIDENTRELLKNPSVNHMSHSYSHLEYKVKNKEEVLSDYNRFKAVFPNIEGIIFPRNRFDQDILNGVSDLGYRYFRDLSKFERILNDLGVSRKLTKVLVALNSFIPIYSINSGISRYGNISGIESSLFIRLNVSRVMLLLQYLRIFLGIIVAVCFRHNVHLWMHPHNLCCSNRNRLYLSSLFRLLGFFVRKGLLRSQNMNTII